MELVRITGNNIDIGHRNAKLVGDDLRVGGEVALALGADARATLIRPLFCTCTLAPSYGPIPVPST